MISVFDVAVMPWKNIGTRILDCKQLRFLHEAALNDARKNDCARHSDFVRICGLVPAFCRIKNQISPPTKASTWFADDDLSQQINLLCNFLMKNQNNRETIYVFEFRFYKTQLLLQNGNNRCASEGKKRTVNVANPAISY